MSYLLLVLLLLVNLCWLALTLLALPGNWLMVGGTALFAWWRWEEGIFGGTTLIVIAVLAVLGEIFEFFAGMGGARRAGGGWKAAFGALVGSIAGGIVGTVMLPVPVLGTLVGAALGAGLISGLIQHSATAHRQEAVRTGMGAGVGVLFGTAAKFAVGILIWVIVAVAAFWP